MDANERKKDASSQVNGEGPQGLTTIPEGWQSGKRRGQRKSWPPLNRQPWHVLWDLCRKGGRVCFGRWCRF